MARPRKQIDVQTHDDFKSYFDELIASNELSSYVKDSETKAIRQYKKIPIYPYCHTETREESMVLDLKQFNDWCDLFITREGWTKLTSRQTSKSHNQAKNIVTLKLEKQAYDVLKRFSKKHHLTNSVAIRVMESIARKHQDEVEKRIKNIK